MSVILDGHRIVDGIESRYRKGNNIWCLLRFEDKAKFSQEYSLFKDPSYFLNFVEKASALGLKFLGGYTDKGVYSLVRVDVNIKDFLLGKRENVGFVNLYWSYFYKPNFPSGILVLTAERFIFAPGLTNVRDELFVDYTNQPNNRKQKLSTSCRKYNLNWWGDVSSPVVFRKHKKDMIDEIELFIDDIENLFDEVGYALI